MIVFIQRLWALECLTCHGHGNFCTLPLNLDTEDESNENDADTGRYNDDFYCEVRFTTREQIKIKIKFISLYFQSDHSFDPKTGKEKLILRGTQVCEELDIPNHRRHCCQSNNCNKVFPPLSWQALADVNPMDARYLTSHYEHIYPSLSLILLSIIILR